VGVIDVVRRLVMQASVSLRAIPRVIGLFTDSTNPAAIVPSASGARWWLQRLELFTLQEPLEVADDWVYLIDHSVQIGSVKVCVIVGLRLSELPRPRGRCGTKTCVCWRCFRRSIPTANGSLSNWSRLRDARKFLGKS
jgi:hypothetical protein